MTSNNSNTTTTTTNTNSSTLRNETIARMRALIARAKRENYPAAAIAALSAALARIERNQGNSHDHAMIANALNAENQLR